MKKQVCVIGLGRFGSTVARELYQTGHDVLAIDLDEGKIQEISGHVTYAVRADATNEEILKEFEVSGYDVAVVALGSDNIQSSILVTVLLKAIGVPYIIARAANEIHGDALDRIGADSVVHPEMDSARRAAHVGFDQVSGAIDYMPVAPNFGISKLRPREAMFNHTLEQEGLGGPDGKRHVSVVAIRRGRRYILNPAKDEIIQPGDVLVVAGTNEHLGQLNGMALG